MHTHAKPINEVDVSGVTPGELSFIENWRNRRQQRVFSQTGRGFQAEAFLRVTDLWLLITWPSGAKLAARCGLFFGCATLLDAQEKDNQCHLTIESPAGRFEIRIEGDPGGAFFHWTTTLRPAENFRVPHWPNDLYPVGPDWDPLGTRGVVHTKQHGTRGAFLFASMTRPAEGSWLYLQNLTALCPYFERTHTSAADRIGSQWPELGFSLPSTGDYTLQKGMEIVLSDGYVIGSEKVPLTTENSAELFLELYSIMYLKIPRPQVEHRDWP